MATVERPNAPARRAPAGERSRARASKPFVAVDGEGVTLGRGHAQRHVYVLLGASTGATLERRDGIATHEALDWLIRLGRESGGILVGFAFNYDVNMILRDVPRELLAELWREGQVHVQLGERWYLLEWIPSKLFAISTDGGECLIYDVFGFFQSSFVRALETWAIGSPDYLADMKARRATFTLDELDEITTYCLAECDLLVQLMEQLRAALLEVELRPRSWLGAGAIASALLAKHKVDQHVPEARPYAVEETLLRAYFGGRTEVFRQGIFAGTVSAWDINSAYPAIAATLPSGHGSWKRERDYDPAAEWAIWRCTWELDDEVLLAPFPFRDKRAIYYPLAGEGWYHAAEVRAALAVYGDAIRISSGYVFTPADDERPFGFLPELYDYRRQLKAAGHAGEKVLKLGINSVYGKLAQGTSRDGRRPRFQDYFYAGAITAGTRARALAAAASNVDALVAIATDGLLFAGGDPELVAGDGLGAWEHTRYRDLFVAQPGMYECRSADRARTVKRTSRGFFVREIRWGALKREWRESGPFGSVTCESTRFVGLGSALARSDFSIWRTWDRGTRKLSLYSSRKFYDSGDEGELVRTLRPPSDVRPGPSDPYTPKRATIELDEEQLEWIAGTEQPDPLQGAS